MVSALLCVSALTASMFCFRMIDAVSPKWGCAVPRGYAIPALNRYLIAVDGTIGGGCVSIMVFCPFRLYYSLLNTAC